MKKTTKVKSPGMSKKRKERQDNIFVNSFAAVAFGGALIWIIFSIYSYEKESYEANEKYKASLPIPGVAVEHSQVCMVNNMYMGSPQIAVPINEKTYYGCCQKCVKDLNMDETTRFAVDPFDNKKVGKALAFITIHPDKTGVVLYSESEQKRKKNI